MPKLKVDLLVNDKGTLVVKNFGNSTNKYMHSAAGSVQVFAGALAAATTVLAGLGAGLAAKSFLETAASFEKMEIQLETIQGSSAAAKESLAWITEFGAKTPYEIAEVTQSFVKLSAYGLDATRWMGTLGDTASAMGKNLDQAVEMFADAVTGEFERLKEFGVKASVKGDQVAFRWSENGKDMVVSANKTQSGISNALEGIFSRFEGGMDRQSETWDGMWSNMMDTVTLFKADVMASGPFDVLKEGLSAVLAEADNLKQSGRLDEWAVQMADAVLASIDAMAAGFNGLGQLIYGFRASFGIVMKEYADFELEGMGGKFSPFKGITDEIEILEERLQKLKNPAIGEKLYDQLFGDQERPLRISSLESEIARLKNAESELLITSAAGAAMAGDNIAAMDNYSQAIDKARAKLEKLRAEIGSPGGKTKSGASSPASPKSGAPISDSADDDPLLFQLTSTSQLYHQQLQDMEDATEETAGQMSEFWKAAMWDMQSTTKNVFVDVLKGNFDDIGQSFLDMTIDMSANWAAAQMQMALWGSAAGGEGEGWIGLAASAVGSYFSAGASGSAGGGSSFTYDSGYFGTIGNANGGVYNSPGLSAYSGTVVNSPTLFPFASGMGLMGEAGPEAILPLERGSDGRLGVVSTGKSSGNVNIVNNITVESSNGDTAKDRQTGSTIGMMIKNELRMFMVNEQRPGGLLNPQGVN